MNWQVFALGMLAVLAVYLHFIGNEIERRAHETQVAEMQR